MSTFSRPALFLGFLRDPAGEPENTLSRRVLRSMTPWYISAKQILNAARSSYKALDQTREPAYDALMKFARAHRYR